MLTKAVVTLAVLLFLITQPASAQERPLSGPSPSATSRQAACQAGWQWNKAAVTSRAQARAQAQRQRYSEQTALLKAQAQQLAEDETILGIINIHDPTLLEVGQIAQAKVIAITFTANMLNAASALDPTGVSKNATRFAEWTPWVLAAAREVGTSIVEKRGSSDAFVQEAATQIADKMAEIEIQRHGGGNTTIAIYRSGRAMQDALKSVHELAQQGKLRQNSLDAFKRAHADLKRKIAQSEQSESAILSAIETFQQGVEQTVQSLCAQGNEGAVADYADPDELLNKFRAEEKARLDSIRTPGEIAGSMQFSTPRVGVPSTSTGSGTGAAGAGWSGDCVVGATDTSGSVPCGGAQGKSANCEPARQQIIANQNWLAEVGPNKDATESHRAAYNAVQQGLERNQTWYNQNCR